MKEKLEIVYPIWEKEMKIIDKIDNGILKILINGAVMSTLKKCGKNIDDFDKIKVWYIVRRDDK